jgi:hypothetical protein
MNRNEKEYRRTKKRLSELEEELQRLSLFGRSARQDEVASAVSDTLRMQIEDQPPLREPRDLHPRAGRGLGRLLRARPQAGRGPRRTERPRGDHRSASQLGVRRPRDLTGAAGALENE